MRCGALAVMALFAFPLNAKQASDAAEPVRAASQSEVQVFERASLPAGTPINLEFLQALTTEGKRWKEGDVFQLAVAEDVFIGEYTVIPTGAQAYGHVRWITGSGAFGKSGKIEVEIDRLVLGGKDIPLSGVYRAEGRGELTNAGTIIAAGPLAGFIAGESAKIGPRTVITARLAQSLGVVIPSKTTKNPSGGSSMMMVRARQISVAEAFPKASNASDKVDKTTANRTTVAEAFKDLVTDPEGSR